MAKQKEELKKGKSYFILTGHAKINDYTFTIDKTSTKSDYVYSRVNLGLDCGEGNIVYAEMMGGYFPDGSSKLYVHGKNPETGKDDFSERITLDWDERNNPDIIKDIGEQCFIRIGLEKDIKGNTVINKFMSPYDAIAYLEEHLAQDMYITVSGSLEYSVYEGETQVKKRIQSVYLVKDEENNPPKAKFTQTFLLHKDFLGKVDTEKNSISANGYVPEYVYKIDDNEIKKTLLIPKSFEFDLNKNNMDVVKKFVQMFLKFKTGYILEIVVDGEFREGVSTVATTYDDLDNDTKTLIALDMLSLEEALANKAISGSREKRMIFTKPYQIETVVKNDDGSESVKKTVAIVPDKYPENEVEYYYDYVEEQLPIDVPKETVETADGTVLDSDSQDFLASLT